jgi:hypothetical protein
MYAGEACTTVAPYLKPPRRRLRTSTFCPKAVKSIHKFQFLVTNLVVNYLIIYVNNMPKWQTNDIFIV